MQLSTEPVELAQPDWAGLGWIWLGTLQYSMHVSRFIGVVVWALVGLGLPAVAAQPSAPHAGATTNVVDSFDDASTWKIITAEGVALTTREVNEGGRKCLAIDYHFISGGGFGLIQKAVSIELPATYAFAFDVKAAKGTPANNLEFKLLDAAGENVWWVNKQAVELPGDWKRTTYRGRHFSFAWGPSGGEPLKQVGKLEFAIASAVGGKGTVYLDNLTFAPLPLPADPASLPAPKLRKAAGLCEVDLGAPRELDGLVVRWKPQAASALAPRASLTTADVETVVQCQDGDRRVCIIHTPDLQASSVNIAMLSGESAEAAIESIEILPAGAATDRNGLLAVVARHTSPGLLPRWTMGKQAFWTVAGAEGASDETLLSEDGTVELSKGGCSISPFWVQNGAATGWGREDETKQSVEAGVPIPSVVQRDKGRGLVQSVALCDTGGVESGMVVARYEVENVSDRRFEATLALGVRPLQVNPPWQALNMNGGFSPIRSVRMAGPTEMVVNDTTHIVLSGHPSVGAVKAGATALNVAPLTPSAVVLEAEVESREGTAVGWFMVEVKLEPGEKGCYYAAFTRGSHAPATSAEWARSLSATAGHEEAAIAATAKRWRERTDIGRMVSIRSSNVRFTRALDTVRSQIADVLINADGPAFQPGSRCYERSWARDGSMTLAAMHQWAVPMREPQGGSHGWIDWFGANQFPSGKIPCVVDTRGPDPVDEHDSTGQYLYAVAEADRFEPSETMLRRHWPSVVKSVDYLLAIRAKRMTEEFDADDRTRSEPGKPPVPVRAFYGLVPESISHEGYSAKPMHSYWDDFFVLKGLKDAAYIAQRLGEKPTADRYAQLAVDFRRTLLASLATTMKAHGINYLPGCVELGDFDATSTAIALSPCDEGEFLPVPAVNATFDKWWAFFKQRRDDPSFVWKDYTPYEVRLIGAMVMLGKKSEALEMLDWYLSEQQPTGWNQWAEVVTKDRYEPRFIGDMPHTWVGSDFLRSVRSMFVFEQVRQEGDSLVLLRGVPADWVVGNELTLRGLPTHFGKLSLTATGTAGPGGRITITITIASLESPAVGAIPGGVEVWSPVDAAAKRVSVDGQPVTAIGPAKVRALPATVVFEY